MKLKRLEVSAFGGINPSSPVIIDFSESKFVTVTGDMGTNKTSLLNALLVACGQLSHTGKEGKNFVNLDSNTIDINFDFVGNDRCNYSVRCTKSKFSLIYDGIDQPEPITKMKKILGVVGVSPMEIKYKPIKEIVKWLAQYTNKNVEDFEKQLDKLKLKIKESEDSRAQANKSLKGLNEYLENETMFTNWEASEKKFNTPVDIKAIRKELDASEIKAANFTAAQNKLSTLKERKFEIEEQIAKLMAEAVQVEDKIKLGEKYLKDNATVQADHDKVKRRYENVSTDAINYNKWQEIKSKKADRDEYETLSQTADAWAKKYLKDRKELYASVLPDIRGAEIIPEDTHEDGEIKKEGIYLNGKNAQQLSETEWTAFVFQILRKFKAKIIVVDNMTSLGTKGVEVLEQFHKDGAYIVAAEMNREQKTLEINYE